MELTNLSAADRELLFTGRWSANAAIAKLKGASSPLEAADLIEDVVDILSEVLDVENPSHVDTDRTPKPQGDRKTVEEETFDGMRGGHPTLGRLFLAVGHNEGTGSRSHDNLDEWATSLKVVQRAKELAGEYGLEVMIGIRERSLSYGQAMRKHGEASDRFGADLAFELHRNAYNRKAKGTESVVASDAGSTAGRIFAAATSLLYPETTLRGNDGLQDRRNGGNGRGFCRAPKAPAIVLEPCFHDNPSEWPAYRDAVEKEARLILGAAKATIMFGFDKVPSITESTEFLNRVFPTGILS